MPNQGHSASRGFTLIELLVTVTLVSIIATMVFPMAEMTVKRNKEHDLRLALRQIRTGIDAYRQAVADGRVESSAQQSGYPPSLLDLVNGLEDKKLSNGSRIYFLRRIPRDPFATDQTLPAEATWGKRSYASPPDNPQEGGDVFDVYSQAAGTGLNGVPYNQW